MKIKTKKPHGISAAAIHPCAILDIILSFLAREIRRKDLPEELRSKTENELRAEYNKRFPMLYGNTLQDMSGDADSGDIPLDFFPFYT